MKKLRYGRVLFAIIMMSVMIVLFVFLIMNSSHVYEYDGDIETYVGTYQQDDKIYTFDLKGFELGEEMYLSLNDMYNVIVIIDPETKVYLDYDKHTMTYQLSDKSYYFDFGHDCIMTEDGRIDLKKYETHIYLSSKNIYLSVSFIEKILFDNEKSIRFENANAIIQ